MSGVTNKLVRLVMSLLPSVDEAVIARREFRRERDIFRNHAEAARRATLTPNQRAYEDWSHAWYDSNKYEDKYKDKESWLRAFEAAAREWNETH